MQGLKMHLHQINIGEEDQMGSGLVLAKSNDPLSEPIKLSQPMPTFKKPKFKIQGLKVHLHQINIGEEDQMGSGLVLAKSNDPLSEPIKLSQPMPTFKKPKFKIQPTKPKKWNFATIFVHIYKSRQLMQTILIFFLYISQW